MKKFIIQILVFLLPIVLLAYFADVFISNTLKKSNSHAQKEYSTWNNIIDGTVNSDIVIYGNSRAWLQINPTMIGDSLKTSAYNLGIDGHNFWLEYLRHTLLLKNNTKPKLIIQSLDNFTLEKKKELYNPDQFLPYMLWDSEIREATKDYEGYDAMDYKIPLLRYYGKLDAFKTVLRLILKPESNTTERIRGYKSADLAWDGTFDKLLKVKKSHTAKLDSASIVLFERYLNECKSKNIKIVFVVAPQYIAGQKFIINRSEIMSIYSDFSEKYNIPILRLL
ncbi:MAG: hypothetical protein IPJ32_17175 [Sphingobacteriaceae bacterium]|nr:hypothetical protein [Sphingobacteriaceae bacterium]